VTSPPPPPQQQQRGSWNNYTIVQDTIPRKNVEDVYSTYRLVNNVDGNTTATTTAENDATHNVNNSNNNGGNTNLQKQQQQQQQQRQQEGQWHRIPSLLLVKGKPTKATFRKRTQRVTWASSLPDFHTSLLKLKTNFNKATPFSESRREPK
jgi:hypothetical protein